ncbi:MAG: RICIN domain-containing protein [Schlesneria sp.]
MKNQFRVDLFMFLLALSGAFVSDSSVLNAEDWGAYAIIPVSAPSLVLEAVGVGADDGTLVSIGKPGKTSNQKWVVTPQGDKFYSIKPLAASGLVLSAAKGAEGHGTAIVLETDKGAPWQLWELKKHESGFYSLIPKHAPQMGLDHFGGKQSPGARIDLWTYKADDQHLHWIIKPLAGTVATAAGSSTETEPTYVIPEIKPEDVPVGEIRSFSFADSLIYPGTVRDVTVFIPAQYDRARPACVYVKTDGYNPHEKGILETLIATKEIPVTVGVFVRPGDLPATVKNTMGRRNRCFEYDGVGDHHVRFLVDELLPFISKKFDLNLSTSGNDRCIAGGSSGGIAAFNAAWERPDAFSRVYANSGSFVAFRGGHEFPTLVRKFEARPIRAFLTTGMRDMENCAGDWFLLDQEMDKSLRFSGYDYKFRIINGGHVAGYYENFPEAMSYIWKDWPKPIKAGPSAPRAQEILVPDENWELVAQDRKTGISATFNAKGEVVFVDPLENKIHLIDVNGKITEILPDAGQANGLSFGADGQLYTVSIKTCKVVSYGLKGGTLDTEGRLVVEGLPGQQVLAAPAGGLYVTSNATTDQESGSVWFVKDGKKTVVGTGLKHATGLAYRPDQWLLSVADGNSKWVHSFQINENGNLTNQERFYWLHVADWEDNAGAQSVCYAKEGQMLVATRWGVQVCADDGPTQVIIPLPDRSRVFGLCFGGKEFDTLFAFSSNKIWKRKLKLHGIGPFSPWMPARASKL